MTLKEIRLIQVLKGCASLSKLSDKEIVKYLHTVNKNFDGISPFDWEIKYGGKKFKIHMKKNCESIK